MKIRIGNDIKLKLTLKGNRNYNRANIKQLRCYFVNTSLCNMCFPFGLSSCNKKCCHSYHVHPCNCCCGCRHHEKYPLTPNNPAHGRGPLPPCYGPTCQCSPVYNRFGGCAKCFHGHECKNWSECCGCCDFDAKFHPYFRPGHDDIIEPMFDSEFKYLAPSKVLEGQNRIETYFPACAQFACGDYKLVVVVVMYEQGWGKCDLHTYTIDYGYVVTLTDDENAPAGDITIDVDNNEIENNTVSNIYTSSDNYKINQNSSLSFEDNDLNNNKYQLNIEYNAGYTIVYDPSQLIENNIQFISSNPSVCEVDLKTGKLTSHNVSTNTDVTITVTVDGVSYSYIVTVVAPGVNYVGYHPSTDPADIVAVLDNPSYFTKVDNVFKTYNLTNTVNGRYLWIVSKDTIGGVYVGGDSQPITGPFVVNGYDYNFYRTENALAALPFNFEIK